MKVKRKKLRLLIIIYLILCILSSLITRSYGFAWSFIYGKFSTTYSDKIERVVGFYKESGNFKFVIKGKLKSPNSDYYTVNVTKENIKSPYSIDKNGIKYIHTKPEDIQPINSLEDLPTLYDDVELDKHGRVIVFEIPETGKKIRVVVKNVTIYSPLYHITRPIAFIIDFLISPLFIIYMIFNFVPR